jgi:hypothetical protein
MSMAGEGAGDVLQPGDLRTPDTMRVLEATLQPLLTGERYRPTDAARLQLRNRALIDLSGHARLHAAKYPHLLLKLCDEAMADMVIIHSRKDAASQLSADDVGAGYNRTRQPACANGVAGEVHHIRKALSDPKPSTPRSTTSTAPSG